MEKKIRVNAKAQNRAALGIFRSYLILNPQTTLESLRAEFPHSVCPDSGVKENFVDINEIRDAQGENWNGYFSKDAELLPLTDGTCVAVTSMWTGKSLARLMELTDPMGIEVNMVDEVPEQTDELPGNEQPVSSKEVRYSIEYLNGWTPEPQERVFVPTDVAFDSNKTVGVMSSQVSSVTLPDGSVLKVTFAGERDQVATLRPVAYKLLENHGVVIKSSWAKNALGTQLIKLFGAWHDKYYQVLVVENLVIQRCNNTNHSDHGTVYVYKIN